MGFLYYSPTLGGAKIADIPVEQAGPSFAITLSARTSNASGTVTPIA
jgi:hypothetical protein